MNSITKRYGVFLNKKTSLLNLITLFQLHRKRASNSTKAGLFPATHQLTLGLPCFPTALAVKSRNLHQGHKIPSTLRPTYLCRPLTVPLELSTFGHSVPAILNASCTSSCLVNTCSLSSSVIQCRKSFPAPWRGSCCFLQAPRHCVRSYEYLVHDAEIHKARHWPRPPDLSLTWYLASTQHTYG